MKAINWKSLEERRRIEYALKSLYPDADFKELNELEMVFECMQITTTEFIQIMTTFSKNRLIIQLNSDGNVAIEDYVIYALSSYSSKTIWDKKDEIRNDMLYKIQFADRISKGEYIKVV